MVIITNNTNRIDKARFSYARSIYLSSNVSDSPGNRSHSGSIGTIGEKSLHAILKLYYEPDHTRHEIAVGAYVADIVGEDGIIEIQTRGLSRLIPKLSALLEVSPVTVVHPIIASRRVVSIDNSTGEVISTRTSPKHGNLFTETREIYALRGFIDCEKLTIRLPVLEAEEFRRFGVKTNRRKKQRRNGSEYLSDIIPTDIIDEIVLGKPDDYAAFIPEVLPRSFSARDFAAAARSGDDSARMAVNMLIRAGLAAKNGRNGRLTSYVLTSCGADKAADK